jgi:hypothetical protein
MFVLRALFWLSLVALFMPRGPVLDIDTSHIRSALAANQGHYLLIDNLRRDVFAIHLRTADASLQPYIQHYRNALLSRLEVARAEMIAARPPISPL